MYENHLGALAQITSCWLVALLLANLRVQNTQQPYFFKWTDLLFLTYTHKLISLIHTNLCIYTYILLDNCTPLTHTPMRTHTDSLHLNSKALVAAGGKARGPDQQSLICVCVCAYRSLSYTFRFNSCSLSRHRGTHCPAVQVAVALSSASSTSEPSDSTHR